MRVTLGDMLAGDFANQALDQGQGAEQLVEMATAFGRALIDLSLAYHEEWGSDDKSH